MTPAMRREASVALARAGTRLMLSVVVADLQVSYADMATAAGISRSALSNLARLGFWPVRMDRKVLSDRIRIFLQEHGASLKQLEVLFEPSCEHDGSAARSKAYPDPRAAAHGADTPIFEDDNMLLPKQALTPQAKRHFRLFINPFDGEVTSDEMMFSGNDVAYVREACWQCSQTGGFVAVVGESGAGKTTMLLDLEARLEREGRGVILIKPSVLGMEQDDNAGKTLKSTDILHTICHQLDGQATIPQTLQARAVRAQKLLTASAMAGNQHLVVVEEAHSLPDAMLRHLKRLHEQRAGRRPLLGILLLAQPELKVRLQRGLASGLLREVAQRLEIVELFPLDADLKAYLQRRAAAANVELANLIDDQAIEEIRSRLTRRMGKQAVSMCYPLAVNNLLTRALNLAAEGGEARVTRDVVQVV